MFPVCDLHCDTLATMHRLIDSGEEVSLRKNCLHVDLEKMKKGGYMLQNFALFVPVDEFPDSTERALRLLELFKRELADNSGLIAQARSFADIERNAAQGKLSALLSIEEGAVCRGDVTLLRAFYDEGVRMLTLTWNFENELGYPHCDSRNRGLKDKGFEFLTEMEDMGVIADVSHLSDRGFWDICHRAKRPFTASHSSCRALCSHSRNLTDEMIKAVADRGGIVGVNYYGRFVKGEENISRVSDIARHVRYTVNTGGLACCALGSDYDGMSSCLEMADCSFLPMLARELSRQGMSDAGIEAVFSGNVLRFYREML